MYHARISKTVSACLTVKHVGGYFVMLEMMWPVLEDLWTRSSSRVPLPSERVSELRSSGQ